jgi:Tol biopolymer transport system component
MKAHNEFDRLLTSMLEERAVPRDPEYLGEVFARTRRMRQRPAWSSPGRWLPMQLKMPRVVVPRAVPILIILALLAALVVAALIGSRPRLPAPFGLAATGQFAFDSNGDIFVSEPDGTGLRALISGPGEATHVGATWSRDGTRLAYTSGSAQMPRGLWVADADGGNAHKVSGDLAINSGSLGGPAAGWSPDGRALVFATLGKLYVVNADGSQPPRPLGDDSLRRQDPVWSPLGTLIAFTGVDDGEMGLYVIRPDGQGETKVGGTTALPDWSPDGTRLLYGMGAEPLGDIFVATFDGRTWTETMLVAEPGDDVMPRWSNDGTRLAFLRCQGPGQACLLYVVAAESGASPRLITDDEESLGYAQPCWSPDDRFIAALSGVPGPMQGQKATTFVLIPADGGPSRVRLPAPAVGTVNACSWQRLAP